MTNDELKSEIMNLSPRIAALLADRFGNKINTELGSLLLAFTHAPDLVSAVNILKSNSASLSAFEDVIATFVRLASLNKNTGIPNTAPRWVIPGVSAVVLVGFFTMLGLLLIGKTDGSKIESVKNVLFTLLGALGAAFTQVINYWLGSSKGSADKTNLLASSQSGV